MTLTFRPLVKYLFSRGGGKSRDEISREKPLAERDDSHVSPRHSNRCELFRTGNVDEQRGFTLTSNDVQDYKELLVYSLRAQVAATATRSAPS